MRNPVQRRPRLARGGLGLVALILAVVGAGLAGAQGAVPAQTSLVHLPLLSSGRAITQPEAISFWGMNAYLTKRERIVSEMADYLLKYDAWRTEMDATLSLYANGKGPFSLFEVMMYGRHLEHALAGQLVGHNLDDD